MLSEWDAKERKWVV